MSHAQWMYMYHAYIADEKRTMDKQTAWFKLGVRSAMEAMITVLGLRFNKAKKKDGDEDESKVTSESTSTKPKQNTPHTDDMDRMLGEMKPFVPFAFLASQPENLKAAMDFAELEDKSEDAMINNPFDKISEAIASGNFEGDMSPLGDMLARFEGRLPPLGPDPIIVEAERQRINESLGIKEHESNEMSQVVSITGKPKTMKIRPV